MSIVVHTVNISTGTQYQTKANEVNGMRIS